MIHLARERSQAVVIGGSLAACMAAKALSASMSVVLVEKGHFADCDKPRPNVPQENHVHLFLQRGMQCLERMFPGITEELLRAGAIRADLGHDVKWYQQGFWKERYPTGIYAVYCSRGLLDRIVRRRILENSAIEVLRGAHVDGLELHEGSPATVKGVRVEVDGQERVLPATLAVDAGGRGSQLPSWLKGAGLGEVECSRVETRLGYASRVYPRNPEYADQWKVLLVLPTAPEEKRMGVISPIEGDRWLVTVGGWHGDYPRPNAAEFDAYLGTLPVDAIRTVVRTTKPLSQVFGMGVEGSRWRHYERFPGLPEGLLVLGDAYCSLNPLYSQGMTIAALEAEALADAADDRRMGEISTVEIQRRFAEIVRPAWEMAKTEDLRFPQTKGKRSWRMKWRHWYGARLAELSAFYRPALQTQLGVANLVLPGRQLYRPDIAGRIARSLFVPRRREA